MSDFSDAYSLSAGYAATITQNGNTLCLDFTSNNASPTSSPNPYSFTCAAGTFERTTGSGTSTNIGQITTSGAIGAPGSCDLD